MNYNSQKHILAIIPARGGSKGIIRKNIKNLAGKPLIGWTIETALKTSIIERIIVSTDDEEIAEVGEFFGAEVPFLRPKELALDNTTDMAVYEHTLDWLMQNEGYLPDIIVWLRPTSPLRTSEDIEKAVELLVESRADWVRSVCKVENHPYWTYRLVNNKMEPFIEGIDIRKYLRRQLLPPAYRVNGNVDVTWRKTIVDKKMLYSGNLHAYVMPVERSLDIDTMIDFVFAEALMGGKLNDFNS